MGETGVKQADRVGPRTILFVLPHLRAGGIEVVVREIVNRLDRRVWRPVLFLGRATGALLPGVAQDVPVIDGQGRRAAALAPLLARTIRAERAEAVYSGTNAVNIATILAMTLLRRAHRPRLVISEHTTAAAWLAGARHSRLRRRLLRGLYPRADRLAVPLQDIGAGWHAALGITQPPIAALPNPVLDPDALAALHADPPDRVAGLIVAAGRLIPDKGHDVLIRAFARLAAPHATLEIYGQGPQQGALQQVIAAQGLEGRVHLRGHSNDLLRALARAQVVAIASRREGFGNVIVEALASGSDIVASDCPGPHALLQGGALGTLVPPGDIDALAAALAARLAAPPDPQRARAAIDSIAPYRSDRAVQVFSDFITALLQHTIPGSDPDVHEFNVSNC